ncbi:hypothetical protein J6590_049620 [Homalodisca vitripennis]|nr:hypothetical protein J6590_049620 [Homalodisca vitripennis]
MVDACYLRPLEHFTLREFTASTVQSFAYGPGPPGQSNKLRDGRPHVFLLFFDRLPANIKFDLLDSPRIRLSLGFAPPPTTTLTPYTPSLLKPSVDDQQ